VVLDNGMELEYSILIGLFGFSFGVPLCILCVLKPGMEFLRIHRQINNEIDELIEKQKQNMAKQEAKRKHQLEVTKIARAKKRNHDHFEHEDRAHDTLHRVADMNSTFVKAPKRKKVDAKSVALKGEKAERKYLSRFHNKKGAKHDQFMNKNDLKNDNNHLALVPAYGDHNDRLHGVKGHKAPAGNHRRPGPVKKKAGQKKGKKKGAKVHADPQARHLSKHQRLAKGNHKKIGIM
jgi:hypothetical protein